MMERIPPLDAFFEVGPPENYFIHDAYVARLENAFFDDTGLEDQWQREVYEFAREVACLHGVRKVVDIGCGSGFKTMKYFFDFETIGMDLPPTVEFLKRKYPAREWQCSDFSRPPELMAEFVVCSDVIEHLPDPHQLLLFIKALQPQFIVISTPDRNLTMEGTHNGPPKNKAHVREWSMRSFELS